MISPSLALQNPNPNFPLCLTKNLFQRAANARIIIILIYMDTLKQLFRQRLLHLKQSILSALTRLQQLQVSPHSPNDYTSRTDLIAEIFLQHLEDSRQAYINSLLSTISCLQQQTTVLSAQLQYLSELNDSMRKQFAESREQEIKSRQLAKLLNEEEATVEEVRREMADKYQHIMQQMLERHQLEVLDMRRRLLGLEIRLWEKEGRTRDEDGQEGINREAGGDNDLVQTRFQVGSPKRKKDCCAWSKSPIQDSRKESIWAKSPQQETESRKGMLETLETTPTKSEYPGNLVYKYIKNPITKAVR